MMTQSAKLRTLLFLAITVIALVLLSTTLSQLDFKPGQPFPFGGFSNSEPATSSMAELPGLPGLLLSWWGIMAVSAFLLLIVLWLIVFILRPEVRKYLLSRLISYVILLLLIAGLLYSLQQSLLGGENQDATEPQSVPIEALAQVEELLTPPATVVDPPRWLVAGISLVLFTLILGIGWFLWTRRPRRRASPAEQIITEARQAVQAIRAGRDLKDTVMNCYLQMTQILAEEQGIHREKTMTPREFERHLTKIGFRDDHIGQLTRLFENVRYGSNTPTEQEERAAVACLNAIAEAHGPPV